MTDEASDRRVARGRAWAWRDAALLLENTPGRPPASGCPSVSAKAYNAELEEIRVYLRGMEARAREESTLREGLSRACQAEEARREGDLICGHCSTRYEESVNGDWTVCPHCGYEYANRAKQGS